MFIRRTTIKSRESGEPYYTYRLVESVRVAAGVRQHTVLNLGRNFKVPRPQWGPGVALHLHFSALRASAALNLEQSDASSWARQGRTQIMRDRLLTHDRAGRK